MHLGVKRSRSVPDHLRSWARLPRNLARFLAALGSPMRREAAAFPCPFTGHMPQSGPSNPRERPGKKKGSLSKFFDKRKTKKKGSLSNQNIRPSNPRERPGSSPGVQEGLLPPCRGPGAKRGSRSSPAQRPAHSRLGRAPRRSPRQGSLPSSLGATHSMTGGRARRQAVGAV